MSVDDIKELVRWRDKADELATLLEQYSIELQQMRAEAATKTIEREEARRERDDAQREVARLNACLSSVTTENQYRAQREARALQDWQALRAERDEARATLEPVEDQLEAAEAKLKSGEAEWATRRCECSADETCKFVRERDEARAELSKLRKDYDSVLEANVGLLDGAPYVDARAAFRRGAEAMREACAQWVDHWVSGHVADKLRDMPIPEEP